MKGRLGQEPPLYHARISISSDRRVYTFNYNNRFIVTVAIETDQALTFRLGSDGNMMSTPFHQQDFLTSPVEQSATVSIRCVGDCQIMSPSRAGFNAILGQLGKPLIYGVNGFYSLEQDLLISWHGRPWSWQSSQIARNQDYFEAELKVRLGPEPWIIYWCMQYYRMHLGFANHKPWLRRPSPVALAGWCSWEAYNRNVSLDKITQDAAFLAKNLNPYGLSILQVDDGYQPLPQPADDNGSYASSFLQTGSRFPGGHKALVDEIRENGLEPGIWVNVAVSNLQFARNSRYIVKGVDEEPLLFDWLNYCLDMTPECLEEEIKPLYQGLVDAGYTYVKVDTLRHLLYDAFRSLVNRGLLTNEAANGRMRELLRAIRESLGDSTYLLACWGALTEVIGFADACRVATDANPGWKAIRMQLFETARWYFAQRILFTLDPDHICVRTRLPWAQSLLTLSSLSGSLVMLSDQTSAYDQERLELIRRTLPPIATTAAETGPVDYTLPAWPLDHNLESRIASTGLLFGSLWCWHLCRGGQNWAVMLRLAIEPLLAVSVPLDYLNLDPEQEYLVFDFWSQNCVGRISRSIDLPEISLGACQVLSFRAVPLRPQLIATDRHVSMDAVSLSEECWIAGDNRLELNLDGFSGLSLTGWIYVPEKFAIKDASVTSRKFPDGQDKSYVAVSSLLPVPGMAGKLAKLTVQFATPAITVAIDVEVQS